MPMEEIQQILMKYGKEEAKIKEAFNSRTRASIKKEFDDRDNQPNVQLHDAINRNKQILKDFELAKGALRSKAIFTPTEVQWENICKKYKEAPALPVTFWRCNMPVFV